MEYQVPQFIEVEDKIVGPLTLRQFIYLAGGGGICVLFIYSLPLILAIVFSAPVAGLACALAFYSINGKPFIDVLESAFEYYSGSKLFIWRKEEEKVAPVVAKPIAPRKVIDNRLTRSKLSDLAWSLDVQKKQESGTVPR